MQISSRSFADGHAIPAEFALAAIDPAPHVALSGNRNPQLEWRDVPEGTKSFAHICHDYDVPSRGDDVNQEGREMPASLPRVLAQAALTGTYPLNPRLTRHELNGGRTLQVAR